MISLVKIIAVLILVVLGASAQTSHLKVADSLFSVGKYSEAVNYLGASTRGIRRKQTFNFEASLRVLYPLAVPIKLGHENEYIHASLALCYKSQGLYTLAKNHFLKAIQYNSQIPVRHTRLGDVYTKLEEHENALASYQMALQLKTAPIAHDLYNIALSYRRQEKWNESIKYIKNPSRKTLHLSELIMC